MTASLNTLSSRHGTAGQSFAIGEDSVLAVENLQKSYHGRRVVDNVSFTVARGEVVGLLGRNGAGKTTSFDMVVGLVKPEKGIIRLENNDLTKTPIHYRSR